MTSTFDAVSAFDAVFSGRSGHFVDTGGRSEELGVNPWSAAPDWVDRELFIDPCDRATIDVGCGPGRLVAEISARGISAMGIDISTEAVRQTRVRGALALRRDVFGVVPGEGRWSYALLADGNLGIGGDPVRLLSRLGHLLAPGGKVLAEVADHGVGLVRDRRRLRVDGQLSSYFEWAVVGLDAIDEVASHAGMAVAATQSAGGRHTVTLVRESS